jgi:hypothetical protein
MELFYSQVKLKSSQVLRLLSLGVVSYIVHWLEGGIKGLGLLFLKEGAKIYPWTVRHQNLPLTRSRLFPLRVSVHELYHMIDNTPFLFATGCWRSCSRAHFCPINWENFGRLCVQNPVTPIGDQLRERLSCIYSIRVSSAYVCTRPFNGHDGAISLFLTTTNGPLIMAFLALRCWIYDNTKSLVVILSLVAFLPSANFP